MFAEGTAKPPLPPPPRQSLLVSSRPGCFWGALEDSAPVHPESRSTGGRGDGGTALPPERSETGLLFRSHLQSGFCYAFWFEMFLRVNVDPFHFLDMDFEDFF